MDIVYVRILKQFNIYETKIKKKKNSKCLEMYLFSYLSQKMINKLSC